EQAIGAKPYRGRGRQAAPCKGGKILGCLSREDSEPAKLQADFLQVQYCIELQSGHAVHGEQAVVVMLSLEYRRPMGKTDHLLAEDWVSPVGTGPGILEVGGISGAGLAADHGGVQLGSGH